MKVDGQRFWAEALRRRNQYFYAWLGWLIAGPCLLYLYTALFPPKHEEWVGGATLVTYGAFWGWTGYRVTSLRCPSCGGRPFPNAMLWGVRGKCKDCGAKYADG